MVSRSPRNIKRRLVGLAFLIGALSFLSLPAALGASPPPPSHAGAYLSHTGKKGPSLNVSLGKDGTATVTQDPGSGTSTLFGHWTEDGANLKVTFFPEDGKPAPPPMIFQPTKDGLQAITWDHALWGAKAPPPMQKASKVKSSYWFTTIR